MKKQKLIKTKKIIKIINLFSNLIIVRNEYLNKKNKKVIDQTPFSRISRSPVEGVTITKMTVQTTIRKKKRAGKKLNFYYYPTESKGKKTHCIFILKNTSGI